MSLRWIFDPNNRQTVFVSGYNDGLYKSLDSGGTWARILGKILTYDFAIHPFDSNIIYAAGYFADKGRVVKTTDGGKSWEEVYSEAAVSVSVRSVALNPSQPNQVISAIAPAVWQKAMTAELPEINKNFEDRINRIYWQNGQVYVLVKSKGLFKSTNLDAGEFTELTLSLTKSDNF